MKVSDCISGLNEWLGKVTAWSILLMTIVALFDITMRYFFRSSIAWAVEINQSYLLPIMALLPSGYVYKTGGHVGVDILYGQLDRRKKAVMDLITSILFFAFCIVLIIFGIKVAYKDFIHGALTVAEPYWPLWPTRLLIPLGAVCLGLEGMVKFVADFQMVFGRTQLEEESGVKM